VIVLERLPDGSFNILNDPPDWFLRLYPQAAARNTTFRTGENLGFLENFLVDAEVFWLSYNGDDRLRSGPWREMEALGTEGWIEATAVLYQGRKILHLEFPAAAAAEKQSLLQAGRRKSLEITARERASQLLERTRDELETRVRERTQELEQLSRKLQLELAERRQAEEALKRSEEQLLQAQKMEAVGKLAAGIAHDFNNLLTVVMGYSEMALSRLDPSGRLFRDVGEIKKSSERAAALTRRLLTFSRKQMLAPRVFDLSAVAINMGELLRQLIGEDVQLIVKCSATEAKVRADPTQVEQVILNLAVNARDAMPHGGVLTIETSHLALNETLTREHLNIPPGPYVVMTVSDTGCGMDKATASRVFEPYFTTKAEGRGSGLGLSTVYGIVTQSGGAIQVESEPGSGSTFTVLLPAAHEDVTLAEPSVLSSEAVRGSEVVLLVEDEEAVRQLVRAILECEGYTVLEARNGTEAVRVAVEYPEPVDLLLTDTVMPGMSAREARQRLTTLHPGMAVLYMSGYSDDIMLGHQLLDGGIPFLQKPFTPEVLLRKVRDVLEERRLRRCGQKGQP
jgi:signal transduction histidine kinase